MVRLKEKVAEDFAALHLEIAGLQQMVAIARNEKESKERMSALVASRVIKLIQQLQTETSSK